MNNFLKNKSIILIFKKYTMTKCRINVSISYNLLFFLMLNLFYNANLLKLYKSIKLRFNIIKFIKAINILNI